MMWSSTFSSKYPDLARIKSYSDVIVDKDMCKALKCELMSATHDLIGSHLESGLMLLFGPHVIWDINPKEQTSIALLKRKTNYVIKDYKVIGQRFKLMFTYS